MNEHRRVSLIALLLIVTSCSPPPDPAVASGSPTASPGAAPTTSTSTSASPSTSTAPSTPPPTYAGLDIGATDSIDDMGFKFEEARKDGLTRTSFYVRWRDLEPSDGKYFFGDVDDMTSRAKAAGMKLTLEIEITNTDCVEYGMTDAECVTPLFPTDQKFSRTGAAFDDPSIARRLGALVSALAARYDSAVLSHVFVGNEVDRYLRVVKHDNKLDLVPGFVRMVGAVRDTVAAAHPKRPRIGTVAEFQPSPEYLDLPPRVCPAVDVLGFTMYPTEEWAEGADAPPAKIQRWMAAARAAVSPCAIAITEVGASAVPPFGSPGEQQAVAASVVAWLRANPTVYEFATWFAMNDNPDPSESVFGGMGLRTRDGVRRPAYATWVSAGLPPK